MNILQRYIVVAEYENIGYFIGSFSSLRKAEEVMEEALLKLEAYTRDVDGFIPNDTMNKYLSYQIHITSKFQLANCPRGNCDGMHFVNVFDTYEVENFTLQQFLFERKNTVYAYDFDKYGNQPRNFVKHDLDLMAN